MSEELTLTAGHAEQGEYEQPPVGEHNALLVDIVLSKNEETKYGTKDVLYFQFELDAEMADGRPFLIRKKFNNSLNEKSNLYKFLSKWRGAPFKNGEAVDLKAMIDTGCVLEIEPWDTPDGKTLHLIDRARKLAKKDWPKASGNYDGDRTRERIEARKVEQFATAALINATNPPEPKQGDLPTGGRTNWKTEDDVPF